ncbi:MAG: cation transporter [Xanthomonadales bacterium]|nr:cation transporter [Xanthomonadales bacterium]MDL1868672.1 cation transporter [Gammaproteobacteria bacterium PRO6]
MASPTSPAVHRLSGHSHDHAEHDHSVRGREAKLFVAFVLTLVTLLAEAIGGYLSGSLALLADAGHMLVDALALLFAWLGARVARRAADAQRSYGYARVEVLVGYTNALSQLVLALWIIIEAAQRLFTPAPILSDLMLGIALAGLAVNALVLRMLHGHDHDDLNTASARLHVLGDLLGSLGAVLAALVIGWFGWLWADPLISVLVALLLLRSAWRLLTRSAHILLEGAPAGVDEATVAQALEHAGIGVCDVHHVHVWQLAGGSSLATLHARMSADAPPAAVLEAARAVLREQFGIIHATIQFEPEPCPPANCGHHHA